MYHHTAGATNSEENVPAIIPTSIAKLNVKIDLLPSTSRKMTGSNVEMDEKIYAKLSQSAYKFGSQKYAADGAVDRFIELIS